MKTLRHLLLAILLAAGTSLAHAQGEAPYTEGSVWDIAMIKTKPGLSDDYLKQLKTIMVGELDAAKKEGLVLSCKILLGSAATPAGFRHSVDDRMQELRHPRRDERQIRRD